MSADSGSSSRPQMGTPEPTIRELAKRVLQKWRFSVSMARTSESDLETFSYPLQIGNSVPFTAMPCQAATAIYYEDRELESKIESVINLAAEEGFRDGIDSRTSKALNSFIAEHPVNGVQQLTMSLLSPHMNQVVAADIVRSLGRIVHALSHSDRVRTAAQLLFSTSPIARDAGSVTLVDLAEGGTWGSVDALEQAIQAEAIPELKADMQTALDELKQMTDAISSEEA